MTNKERQRSLDKKKWIESQKQHCDMSGAMEYCDHCHEQDWMLNECDATQEQREQNCICATAYNRMIRRDKDAKVHGL